jgi:thymidine kinase
MLTVISGCMKASKSKKLLDYIDKAIYQEKKFKIFCPECLLEKKIKTRMYETDYKQVIGVQSVNNIYADIKDLDIIFIDEVQFLNCISDNYYSDLLLFLQYCQKNNIDIVCAGLDLDFKAESFPITQILMSYADKVIKLHAVCEVCKDKANRTLRLNSGLPEQKTSKTLVLDGNNPLIEYKAVCSKCYNKVYGW